MVSMTFLEHLECSSCSRVYPSDLVQTYCKDCNAPLLARYDLEAARTHLDRDAFLHHSGGLWRWRELLPLDAPEDALSLGEGDTPLIRLTRLSAELDFSYLFMKDESRNPTGSFKARGLAVALSRARELGIQKVIIPTAGNAGGALAAYSAIGGFQAMVYMPSDSPRANIVECQVCGAQVILVDGLINDAARLVAEKARNEGWFDVSTFKEPYRPEGKKIMGYELAESFGWKLPEVIIFPTGGGTGLVGMWKAFSEITMLGWLEKSDLPRMVAVQSEGCAPVVRAYESGSLACDLWESAHTIAVGLRVPKSFADRLILQSIRESHGTAIAVSEEDIQNAQRRLAVTEGILASPEGAATLAALERLIQSDWVRPEERIVLFNTCTGLKYL
jgi:threonine synthase